MLYTRTTKWLAVKNLERRMALLALFCTLPSLTSGLPGRRLHLARAVAGGGPFAAYMFVPRDPQQGRDRAAPRRPLHGADGVVGRGAPALLILSAARVIESVAELRTRCPTVVDAPRELHHLRGDRVCLRAVLVYRQFGLSGAGLGWASLLYALDAGFSQRVGWDAARTRCSPSRSASPASCCMAAPARRVEPCYSRWRAAASRFSLLSADSACPRSATSWLAAQRRSRAARAACARVVALAVSAACMSYIWLRQRRRGSRRCRALIEASWDHRAGSARLGRSLPGLARDNCDAADRQLSLVVPGARVPDPGVLHRGARGPLVPLLPLRTEEPGDGPLGRRRGATGARPPRERRAARMSAAPASSRSVSTACSGRGW